MIAPRGMTTTSPSPTKASGSRPTWTTPSAIRSSPGRMRCPLWGERDTPLSVLKEGQISVLFSFLTNVSEAGFRLWNYSAYIAPIIANRQNRRAILAI